MNVPSPNDRHGLPRWTYYVPLAAGVLFLLHLFVHVGLFYAVMAAALIGSVLAAVQHGEVIAHQIGEPLGSVVLAVAVTVIEVSLIVSLMFSGQRNDSALARDAVFAAVMIILNGMVGLCILIGAIRHRQQSFSLQGISSALTILVAISTLTLILPNYTTSAPGPFYSKDQLVFVAAVTLLLYGTFILVQNFRHPALFLQPGNTPEEGHKKPGRKMALVSLLLLIICLVMVVLLAEGLAPVLESGMASIGAPHALVGVVIALVVLLPEGLSAIQAARQNKLQKSLNLSLGSALASIGLTIPTVSVIAVLTGSPLTLGIDMKETVLFLLTLLVITLSLSTGKTTILQGVVLLIIFSVYLFTMISP